MIKKTLISIVLSTLAISNAFACWFTQENFNNAYIAGVNYFIEHYAPTASLQNAVFKNGQSVSLPLTVWFKVSPRIYSVNGQIHTYDIRIAKLYYKILPNGIENSNCKWRLAKSINMGNNPRWRMDFNSPVKLFGNNTITLSLIASKGDTIHTGDHIILAWYIADNSPDCIANAEDIVDGNNNPVITVQNNETASKTYNNEFRPSYIMRVIYNGRKSPSR